VKECPKCGGTGRVVDDTILGAELRQLREAKDRSLRSVAAGLKLSPAYISDLEHGRRSWSGTLEANYRKELEV